MYITTCAVLCCLVCVLRYFNYLWLGFPMKLFPKAVAALKELVQCPNADELLARPDLSRYLRRAIEFMQNNGQNEAEIKGHNLVYLHINYNTFRLAFWALSNLLETPAAVEALQHELDELLETRYDPATDTFKLDAKDIENLTVLGMLQLNAASCWLSTVKICLYSLLISRRTLTLLSPALCLQIACLETVCIVCDKVTDKSEK